ncbi:ion transporter [Phaeovulum sp. W22_SRMD_FR3]|uniref:ion transporter n=1 Tax=Phaeovulum sp. W22_SRMD_FR3 TaxID=3240274 RepID=UPI003F96D1AF
MTLEPGLRRKAQSFVEREVVKNTIMGVIIFNAITLGMSTSSTIMDKIGPELLLVDQIVLGIFVCELLLKVFAYRLKFFSNPWNIFDLIVVGIGLMPDRGQLSALRGLRVIRALRLLSVVPQMRSVVQALLDALPGMGAVIIMLSIVYYVFAVMATLMYGPSFPEWFGTLGRSFYSLFQIMTLESWSMGIVRPVMEVHPNAWVFFVPFIVLTAFSVLNLFIGLLVNTMQSAVEVETEAEIEKLHEFVERESIASAERLEALLAEMRALRSEVAGLKSQARG